MLHDFILIESKPIELFLSVVILITLSEKAQLKDNPCLFYQIVFVSYHVA